ncbi:MAG: SIMPL domain-containing protein [Mariniblastus sp.]
MIQNLKTLRSQLLIIGLILLVQANSKADESKTPTITVTGKAEVRVAPDEAVLTFTIESRETELDAAVKDNDEKIKSVTEFLKGSKVEPKNIRTRVISIRPIFEDNAKYGYQSKLPFQTAQTNVPLAKPVDPAKKKSPLKPIGYTASRQLSVTITNLDSFEDVYRGLIERGVNNVGGIEFRTSELRKYRDEARLKAVRAAREKATAMAGELGATLAAVQTITEDNGNRYSNFSMQNVSVPSISRGSSSIASGTIEITASVRIVFELGNNKLEN